MAETTADRENRQREKNVLEKYHFTVVIPTRERCDTLEHALRTCVSQDYEDLEIIVSDNASQDDTREVVSSYKDSRIRYIHTDKRLSMTANFEFAMSHAEPRGYVLYIGDDDGLLPNAICELNAAVAQRQASVFRWTPASYGWPTAESSCANHITIRSLDPGIYERSSALTIQNVLSFKEPYTSLPLIYQHSAVSFEVIRNVKALSGHFYHSMTPDVYSGFSIAGTTKTFACSKRPYVVQGTSRHSNGASSIGASLSSPALKFLSEDNSPFHSSLVFCPGSIPLLVAECFLQARDYLGLSQRFSVDMERMLFLMMKEAAPKSDELYVAVRDAVTRIGQMHNVPEAAARAIAANPKRQPGSGRRLTPRNLISAVLELTRLFATDVRKQSLYLDCSSFNVNNIYDASVLCGHIFRLNDLGVLGLSAVVKSSLTNIARIINPAREC